jgi:hypothetical protein
MMAVYRVQFDYPPMQGVREQSTVTPICMACAAGHHEQPMLAHESCDCPCHGTPPESDDPRGPHD